MAVAVTPSLPCCRVAVVVATDARDECVVSFTQCCRESNEAQCGGGSGDGDKSVMLPSDGDDQHVVWASGFAVNGFVRVEPPRLHDRWTLVSFSDTTLASFQPIVKQIDLLS